MIRRNVLGLAFAGVLPGCSLTRSRTQVESTVDVPASWPAGGGLGPVETNWWFGFGDPALSTLVAEAMTANLDIRLASARLDEARSLADAQRGAEWPSLDAGAVRMRSRAVSDVTLRPYFSIGTQLQMQASYEVDLWGRVQDLVRAGGATSSAAQAARDSVKLGVAATVASAYISLRAVDAQQELTRQTLASRTKSLDITRSRQQRGYASALETAQAEAEWRATAEILPAQALAASRQQRAIDVLLARVPQEATRGKLLMDIVAPPVPDAGVPSDLLRRRPDIASAEQQVAAADLQLAAARAQMLPSIRLTGAIGEVESTVLRGDPFSIWSIGGSILAPIFHGGQLMALAHASASRRDEALIGYQRAVYTAFAEVETQLVACRELTNQLEATTARRDAVAESLRLAKHRYEEGYSSYLDQLFAERSLFAVDQTILSLHADILSSEVSLYRALGGGWSVDAPMLGPE